MPVSTDRNEFSGSRDRQSKKEKVKLIREERNNVQVRQEQEASITTTAPRKQQNTSGGGTIPEKH